MGARNLAASHPMSQLLDALAGVPNACEPIPGIVTGGQPGPEHLAALRRAGCQVVVDIRAAMEPRPFAVPDAPLAAGLEYRHIPLGPGPAAAAWARRCCRTFSSNRGWRKRRPWRSRCGWACAAPGSSSRRSSTRAAARGSRRPSRKAVPVQPHLADLAVPGLAEHGAPRIHPLAGAPAPIGTAELRGEPGTRHVDLPGLERRLGLVAGD